MRDTDLYSRILGISQPWSVTLVELDSAASAVIVTVRLDSAATVQCPHCGHVCPRYDHRRRRWRHLDTMQYQTILEADVPRVSCPEHGVVQMQVPWAEPGSSFTALFEALVIDWLTVASHAAVARMMGLSWDSVDGIMQRAVRRGLARRQSAAPQDISVDETAFQRRHEYVTAVVDQTSGHVVHVADGRSSESLASYYRSLSEEELAGIQTVSMDMSAAYISATREYVPDAEQKICFDKFHVAQYLGNAVNSVRRQEHQRLSREGDTRLKGTRFYWLENPETMSSERARIVNDLATSGLATGSAWLLKEWGMQLWGYVTRGWAVKGWTTWIEWAEASALEPMVKVAATIKNHLWGIVNAVVHKKTNAPSESMNSRIQRIKLRACGFRNRDRFRAAIMFHCGGLDLYPRPATMT